MKADLSRSTDQPDKHYRGVRMQQGRVQLDADWNEQQDILNRRIETETRDSIGPSGVPLAAPGFLLSGNGQNIDISAGRLYLDGLLCDNPQALKLVGKRPGEGLPAERGQPDLDSRISPVLAGNASLLALPPASATEQDRVRVYDASGAAQAPANGRYIGYLEAWLRHVTALEDERIREVALGGPDSATRDQLVWQVKLLRVGDVGANLSCLSAIPAWTELARPSDARLAARAEPDAPSKDLCLLSPEAGYQRLENQLYRVEIHHDGVPSGTRSFKWSRDNGSIVSRLTGWLNDPVANEIEVASVGRDPYLAITAGCWLEIFNDDHEQTGRSGPLVQVLKTEGNRVTLDLASATVALTDDLFGHHPRVRRWDGWRTFTPLSGAFGDNDGWLKLEDGVEVRLAAGKLRVGDFWTIPARTATADVEWPEEGGKPAFVLAQGVLRAFTRLALLECQGGIWTRISDCRTLFPALTELTNLYYVGGDGQQAMPDPLAPQPVALASPLQVAVYNGQFPVPGAQVRFSASAGLLPNGLAQQVVATDVNGVAAVIWRLAPSVQNPTCSAELLLAGAPAPDRFNEIHFSASLAVASQVAYDPAGCPDMQAEGVNTVQEALDFLCRHEHTGGCCVTVGKQGDYPTLDRALRELLKRDERDICLCLLPGDHHLDKDLEVDGHGANLLIHGAGGASRLYLKGQPFSLTRFASLDLHDFDVFGDEQGEVALRLSDCERLSLRRLELAGLTRPGSSLLQIAKCRQVELVRLFIASLEKSTVPGAGDRNIELQGPRGFALMLADVQGDVNLTDSIVAGRISLYGESSGDDTLDRAALKRLHDLPLGDGFGKLYLGNSRLGDIRLGDELLKLLMNGQPPQARYFSSVIGNDNVLGNGLSQWLAVRVALSQNRMPQHLEEVGFVVASEGKYLGNFCQGARLLLTAGHTPEAFGNGKLSIV